MCLYLSSNIKYVFNLSIMQCLHKINTFALRLQSLGIDISRAFVFFCLQPDCLWVIWGSTDTKRPVRFRGGKKTKANVYFCRSSSPPTTSSSRDFMRGSDLVLKSQICWRVCLRFSTVFNVWRVSALTLKSSNAKKKGTLNKKWTAHTPHRNYVVKECNYCASVKLTFQNVAVDIARVSTIYNKSKYLKRKSLSVHFMKLTHSNSG